MSLRDISRNAILLRCALDVNLDFRIRGSADASQRTPAVVSNGAGLGGRAFGLVGCFDAMFCAITHAADAIAQEMKNAVHGSRVFAARKIAGAQTSTVNVLIMPASA